MAAEALFGGAACGRVRASPGLCGAGPSGRVVRGLVVTGADGGREGGLCSVDLGPTGGAGGFLCFGWLRCGWSEGFLC